MRDSVDARGPNVSLPMGERTLVALIGAVQFINILDFMMVMPLGPDFAKALDIPSSSLGLIGGSYTAAAAVAGLAGAFFLDRFDRRKALAVSMFGLVAGTFAGGLAWNLPSLMAARVLAGIFGGPATSVSLSIIADVIPTERRGRAMGAVMGAFSAASVLGVPAGLELARVGGWRMPFVAVGTLGLVVNVVGVALLPPLRLHLVERKRAPSLRELTSLFVRPTHLFAFAALGLSMMSGFMLVPNISAHLQQNMHYPRESLGILYLVGGSLSFVSMRSAGRLVDRFGATAVNVLGTAVWLVDVVFGFVAWQLGVPVLVLFAAFMLAQTTRNVATNTLMSKVPAPHERAGFLSLQSATQHMASALGAMWSSRILSDAADGSLDGVPTLAFIAMGLAALAPVFLAVVEARVKRAGAR